MVGIFGDGQFSTVAFGTYPILIADRFNLVPKFAFLVDKQADFLYAMRIQHFSD